MCVLVAVCERDGEGLSDLKRERIFQDAISLACQSFQPCKKDNLAKYSWLYSMGGTVCKCENVLQMCLRWTTYGKH